MTWHRALPESDRTGRDVAIGRVHGRLFRFAPGCAGLSEKIDVPEVLTLPSPANWKREARGPRAEPAWVGGGGWLWIAPGGGRKASAPRPFSFASDVSAQAARRSLRLAFP